MDYIVYSFPSEGFALNPHFEENIMAFLGDNFLPLCWLLGIIIALRWFHNLASRPRCEAYDGPLGKIIEDTDDDTETGISPWGSHLARRVEA
jgi:hypothetical protein